jgi:hypothetical protein
MDAHRMPMPDRPAISEADGGPIPAEALDAALLAAHEARDGPALARLYARAGDWRERAGDVDAACFYLTHAYVYALEEGAPEAAALHARLRAHGREA